MNNTALVVGNFLSGTLGTRSVCEDLSIGLTSAGWTILTASNKPARLARMLDMITTAWNKRRSYVVAQVDVYSGLAFGWAEVMCLTLQLARKPYVLTLHGGNLPNFARRWPGRVKYLLHSAAIVTTPSAYLYEQMLPYCDNMRLIPNALDISSYRFSLRSLPGPRLIWLRAFHQIYNPSLAPQALSRLMVDIPDAQLIMVGPDKGDGSLQQTLADAARLGVANRMTVPGGVSKPDVSRLLNTGDIFLNTTNYDNTPISVLEAMACGLCVVSTNVGGIPYMLEHEKDALLVPPDDPDAMAAAVRRLLTEPGLGARLSQNGRVKAEQFDWSTVLLQWENLLFAVVKNTAE
jgi:glycosyltransferase involved in cell wall biosynthesis